MVKHTGIPAESANFVINQAMLASVLQKSNPDAPTALIGVVVRAMVGSGVAMADVAVGLTKGQGIGKRAAPSK